MRTSYRFVMSYSVLTLWLSPMLEPFLLKFIGQGYLQLYSVLYQWHGGKKIVAIDFDGDFMGEKLWVWLVG